MIVIPFDAVTVKPHIFYETFLGIALFQSIKEEWIREYIGEGQRLEGLKRWGDGFTRHDPQNANILSTGTGMETLSISPDDIRFVWEIPANDQNANQNLEPNWN